LIAMMAVIGFYALENNKRIRVSFEEGEKHFRDITTAAAEASSYAKRAEGHLLLYLMFGRKADKDKFPKRMASLDEQVSILDEKIENPEARKILGGIKQHTGGILSAGNMLMACHDNDLKNAGRFEMEKHRETTLRIHEDLSAIRELGVELAAFEIGLEHNLKLNALKNAKRMQLYLLMLIALASGFTVFFGYVMGRMMRTLHTEIANRIRSEQAVNLERDRLKDALANVRTLSGLLPICASCKKIRDDKGYWNRIESYLRDHSDAVFSHGICPECAEKIYPDLFEENEP